MSDCERVAVSIFFFQTLGGAEMETPLATEKNDDSCPVSQSRPEVRWGKGRGEREEERMY